MTVSEIISRADTIRPNAVPREVKLGFLSDVEGQVRVLICKDLPEDTKPLTEADTGKVLTAGGPFERLYWLYLCAMYAYYAQDTELYANDRVVFEKAWSDYAKWYQRTGGGARDGNV